MPPADAEHAAACAPPDTIAAAVRHATTTLSRAGIDTPSLDARLLVAHVVSLAPDRLLSAADRRLVVGERAAVHDAIVRRLSGEPVSRILGYREFWGRRFAITPATLDPRPETETLVEAALAILAREKQDRPRLLDIGTGSGCILLTLLAELLGATGTATDISNAALDAARENAARLGVLDRVDFRLASALDGLAGPYDMLLSNPPYVRSSDIAGLAPEVAQHDPHTALDGGSDGLDIYRLIVREAARVVPTGWIVLEVGHDQANQVLALARDTGAIVVATSATYMDLGGRQRCVAWRTHV